MSRWKLTLRSGPKVERVRAESLGRGARNALEMHARATANTERLAAVDVHVRRYEPADQVALRAELRGPGVIAGGVDVRGDGSVAAWTGRVRRRELTPADGESPYEALRGAVQSTSVEAVAPQPARVLAPVGHPALQGDSRQNFGEWSMTSR